MAKARCSRQSGQAIVIIALMLTLLVGMTALAIDGSRAYALRRDLQAAVDAAALAASDKLQQSAGNYTAAEQAARDIFSANMRLYTTPTCGTWGAPSVGAPLTVTCTWSPGGTTLTQVVRTLGPQGSEFAVSATRNLQLQFALMLTNGTIPTLTATSTGTVNNLRYTPAIAALDQAGCGGTSGSAITVQTGSTMTVTGDVVSNGAITVTSPASLRVTGDVYARCQPPPVPNTATNCYPSGSTVMPCTTSGDVAGATLTGYRFVDPGYPAPFVPGGSQALGTNAVLSPGSYAAAPNFGTGKCWFLSGGVYQWQLGYTNTADFVSNELKPPDEPATNSNTTLSPNQLWNTGGFRCAGSFNIFLKNDPPHGIPNGLWGVVLTSVRTDTYAGVSYSRESAPSMCRALNTASKNDIVIQISNVPGATSYNLYLNRGGGCSGPPGFVGNIPVTGTVQNNATSPCPIYNGNGCSLGNEQLVIDDIYLGTWNQGTAPQPPSGDRANENLCRTVAGAYAPCPSAVTPGAVEFYIPSGGCLTAQANGDNYIFSGYQYNWIDVYEPVANTCANTFGATSNSAFIGLVYAPGASATFLSPHVFDGPGSGGLIFKTIGFSGTPPAINYNAAYAPTPPAARLVS
jgi:Flp pilus assembly protein TadG